MLGWGSAKGVLTMAVDIAFNSEGNFINQANDYKTVSDAEEVAQASVFNLLTIRGESGYDQSIGVDWFGIMFPTSPSYEEKAFELKRAILSTNGIRSLKSLVFEVDSTTRTARVSYEANTIYGPISVNEGLDING